MSPAEKSSPFKMTLHQLMSFSIGVLTLAVVMDHCGAMRKPIIISKVEKLSFFSQIADPCEVPPPSTTPPPLNNLKNFGAKTRKPTKPPKKLEDPVYDFYQRAVMSVTKAGTKVERMGNIEPSILECNEIGLYSLPVTPSLHDLSAKQTVQETYKSLVYLATHFHLMLLDREVSYLSTTSALSPGQQLQFFHRWYLPVLLRRHPCQNQVEILSDILQDLTSLLQKVLCDLSSTFSQEDAASFRNSTLRTLQDTILFRGVDESCSDVQSRDCLIVRNAQETFKMMGKKFTMLSRQRLTMAKDKFKGNAINDYWVDDRNLMNNTILPHFRHKSVMQWIALSMSLIITPE